MNKSRFTQLTSSSRVYLANEITPARVDRTLRRLDDWRFDTGFVGSGNALVLWNSVERRWCYRWDVHRIPDVGLVPSEDDCGRATVASWTSSIFPTTGK